MKKQRQIILTCPYCGAVIGKASSLEQTELACHKCKSMLMLNYKNNVLTVKEVVADYIAEA